MRSRGITLIELIIAALLFSVIVGCVYGAFSVGIKTWKDYDEQESLMNIRMAFLKMGKELRDSFYFSKIPFEGTEMEMRFPLSLGRAPSEIEYIYQVTYSVGEDHSTGLARLDRERTIYTGRPGRQDSKKTTLLSSMRDITFEYAHPVGSPLRRYEWKKTWDGSIQECLPPAVRISLQRVDRDESYRKVVFVRQEDMELE